MKIIKTIFLLIYLKISKSKTNLIQELKIKFDWIMKITTKIENKFVWKKSFCLKKWDREKKIESGLANIK